MLSADFDAFLSAQSERSPWPVSGTARFTVYRVMPAPLAEPPELAIAVEVEVADGEIDGPATLKGTNLVVPLTDEEQAEAIYLVELQ